MKAPHFLYEPLPTQCSSEHPNTTVTEAAKCGAAGQPTAAQRLSLWLSARSYSEPVGTGLLSFTCVYPKLRHRPRLFLSVCEVN